MEAKSIIWKYVRISPRKVQIVCDLIRGKDAKTAMAILMEHPRRPPASLWLKLLKSACANAENNFSMDPDKLYVAEVYATPGPILKRDDARERRAVPTASTREPPHHAGRRGREG